MRKMLCCAVALAALNLVLLSDVSHGQNKQPAKKTAAPQQKDATPQDYAQLMQQKEINGYIVYVDAGAGTMTIRMNFQQLVPNTKSNPNNKNLNAQQQALMRSQQQIMRDYQQIMSSRNPAQQQQRMQKLMMDYQQLQTRMAQAGLNPNNNQFQTVTVSKEFEIELAPMADLRVARVKLEDTYDDKGNIATFTEAELKKMRDPTMPGYKAKVEDLTAGQKVTLYASVKPKANKTDPKNNKVETKKLDEGDEPKTGATDKTKTTDTPPPPRPFVRMILIVAEPDPSTLPKATKKKKKNNN